MTDRYDSSLNIEGQYQPGSDGLVLLNKLAITDQQEMADIELGLLDDLYDEVLSSIEVDQRLTVETIFEWHRKWLGNVYEWAGQQRSLNMSKGGFVFAIASQIPSCLKALEQKYLNELTPCHSMDEATLLNAIARIHVEFILVHPFREGNGRIARLLADVMALQANKPQLDYSSWDANREYYFAAVQAGLAGDYAPMQTLLRQALRDAERRLSD
jgi:cell filamentation protein